MLKTIETLQQMAMEIQQPDLGRCERTFQPVQPGEQIVLGIFDDPELRNWWALYIKLLGLRDDAMNQQAYRANTVEDEEVAQVQAQYYNDLRRLAKRVFWAEVRERMRPQDKAGAIPKRDVLSLRSGWVVVRLIPASDCPLGPDCPVCHGTGGGALHSLMGTVRSKEEMIEFVRKFGQSIFMGMGMGGPDEGGGGEGGGQGGGSGDVQ